MFHKTMFLVAALCFGAASLSAQTPTYKYGHMNLGNLLETMPETKKANDDLKVFTDKITAKDDSLTKAFGVAYEQLEKDYQAGTVPPVQLEQRKVELQKQQEFIQKFEQDAQQLVNSKREELLKPILSRIDEAVKQVAKDNGFLMVFDTGSGIMLFASETEDVTPLVKKKLGM
jgi:outer membrane protein